MFMATRRRLALWYTAVTAILLLLFASGFYLYVRSTLIERVDDTLHHVVEVVERSLVIEPKAVLNQALSYEVNLEASFRQDSQAVEDDRIELEWFDAQRHLRWSTLSESLNLPVHLTHHPETIAITPEVLWRQLTEEIRVDGNLVGYLRVSHPWFEVTKPTRQLVLELSLGTSTLVVLVAAIGWFLSRLAIEPIRESYESLKQFTADASHELRNPIALIQTNVQAALSDPEMTPQDQRQQLETVERVTQRLGRLVDDLLFLARQDSGMIQSQFQDCPLDALLMEVLEEQRAIAQAHSVQIQLQLGDDRDPKGPGTDPFTLQGDYDQISRLFTNLVSNAIQYSPPNGTVTLKLTRKISQGQATLKVTVQDQGQGIPPEAIPRLFDRFYRVDSARSRPASAGVQSGKSPKGGTGLGLAIAQAIAQAHQGSIRVISTPGTGTKFTVLLPIGTSKGRKPSA
ncbi:sensor histidine kinase [Lyngbya confervoides]|uniref:histidine kinase n=1 Tax=Lyngbya confervoides BDU141951 TaxID=1574623 RepID=A0ABD4TA15_9CYAN|nr:ATP-binding protein [Lyngbya confervoides]MCM1985223.1 ATP-binding protein [Lyngbya confervoides BDU141951]